MQYVFYYKIMGSYCLAASIPDLPLWIVEYLDCSFPALETISLIVTYSCQRVCSSYLSGKVELSYLTDSLCELSEGQIQFDVIEGIDNHKRLCKFPTKVVTLTPIAFDDIEPLEEFGLKEMQNNRILRMIEEAYGEGCLLDTKRVCFLVNMTDRALRDRLKPLWTKGVRAPLAMMNHLAREQMVSFRQSICVEEYPKGAVLKTVRQSLAISESVWEQICACFRHIYHSNLKQLAIPVELVGEFNEVAQNYNLKRLLILGAT